MSTPPQPRIAVLLPCYNEAASIGKVVAAFYRALPTANIYVYDNKSTDNTAEVALSAGAIVQREPHRGKGNVVRRMFNDIEADVYVMADDHCQPADDGASPIVLWTGCIVVGVAFVWIGGTDFL